MVRWGDNGDSFVITDIEKFIKILPNYFKTRNYASFVRQLNMYDFFKVKGGKNHQEFKHTHFRRNYYKELAYIKRKSVHKSLNDLEPLIDEQSEVDDNVQDKLEAVRKSLDIVTAQNKNLIDANKEMISRLYNFKGEYEVRIKKLFFVFMVLVHNYDDELLLALRIPLEKLNINLAGLSADRSGADASRYVEALCRKMVAQDMDNHKLLDELMEVFFTYFESKGSPIKRENFNWAEANGHLNNDDFSISLFNAENVEEAHEPKIRISRMFKVNNVDIPKIENNRTFLFRETQNQNLLQSPTKPNEINFDELNNNDEQANALLDKKDDDSFLMSGANSVLMLSPFKRNI